VLGSSSSRQSSGLLARALPLKQHSRIVGRKMDRAYVPCANGNNQVRWCGTQVRLCPVLPPRASRCTAAAPVGRLMLNNGTPFSPHRQADIADLPRQQQQQQSDPADVLTESAAAPRPAAAYPPHQPTPSTSGRGAPPQPPAPRLPPALEAAGARIIDAAAAALPEEPAISARGVGLLPERDYGSLRGGQYPFQYDPVYGLPVVREVVRYGELLRDIRQGEVRVCVGVGLVGGCSRQLWRDVLTCVREREREGGSERERERRGGAAACDTSNWRC